MAEGVATWAEAMGYLGGILLALCVVPQLIKVFRTRSAGDIAYSWLVIYLFGLVFTMVYLIEVAAIAAYVPMAFEIFVALVLLVVKAAVDNKRKNTNESVVKANEDLEQVNEPESGRISNDSLV